MNTVLQGQEGHSSAYIDDIVIFSGTWEDHLTHVEFVLLALREHGLTAKPSKCQWGSQSFIYLGHEVGRGKVSVLEAKITAIRDYKQPKTKRDLEAFLGTTGYYHKFIRNYADHSLQLTNTTRSRL